jgi:phospholipase/carboxylesterase
MTGTPGEGPHAGAPLRTTGVDLESARVAGLFVHGRGARAEGMLGLASDLDVDGLAAVAPQATSGTWYPERFLAPVAANEPHLSSALGVVETTLETLAAAGLPPERVVVVGFSQGACLAAEYVARTPRRYGGLAVLSGGLVGPTGTEFGHEGDLAGTPAYLTCADSDPHIPIERVHETRDVLERMGADVTEHVRPGRDHSVPREAVGVLEDYLRAAGGD